MLRVLVVVVVVSTQVKLLVVSSAERVFRNKSILKSMRRRRQDTQNGLIGHELYDH
jgi:hypothetical protein